MIEDGSRVLIESAAIIDYLIRRHGSGQLQPDPATDAYDSYVQWLHFAEGSAMLPLMLNLYVGRLGDAGAPLHPRIESELANYLGYLDDVLGHTPYLVGDALSGADIQMSFIGEVAQAQGKLQAYPNLAAWLQSSRRGRLIARRWSGVGNTRLPNSQKPCWRRLALMPVS